MKYFTSLGLLLLTTFTLARGADITPKTPQPKVTQTNKAQKLVHKYYCTIYYTPKESGFSGGTVPVTVSGVGTVNIKSSFKARMDIEGCGQISSAINGMSILNASGTPGVYDLIANPVGTGGTVLQPKKSCASDKTVLKKGWKLLLDDSSIDTAFGTKEFTVADVGGGINGYEIDLYWGIDDPNSAGPSRPAGTSFTDASDVTVYKVN